jgi:hypothetical protein
MEAETRLPLPHNAFLTAWETRRERTVVTPPCDKGDRRSVSKAHSKPANSWSLSPALARPGLNGASKLVSALAGPLARLQTQGALQGPYAVPSPLVRLRDSASCGNVPSAEALGFDMAALRAHGALTPEQEAVIPRPVERESPARCDSATRERPSRQGRYIKAHRFNGGDASVMKRGPEPVFRAKRRHTAMFIFRLFAANAAPGLRFNYPWACVTVNRH